jgi:hypothetical protein
VGYFGLLALALGAILGCGGGSKSTPPPPPPPLATANLPGAWIENSNAISYMLILPSTGTASPMRALGVNNLIQISMGLTLTGGNLV